MSDKKQRPRTERRVSERAARDLVKQRQRLALLEPGGSAERPIEVPSSSVIELRARSQPCPLCAGGYAIEDHQAPNAVLRAVVVVCQRCGVRRTLYFRLGAVLTS